MFGDLLQAERERFNRAWAEKLQGQGKALRQNARENDAVAKAEGKRKINGFAKDGIVRDDTSLGVENQKDYRIAITKDEWNRAGGVLVQLCVFRQSKFRNRSEWSGPRRIRAAGNKFKFDSYGDS